MRLRLLEEKDVPYMLEWMHDPTVNCFFQFNAASMTRQNAISFIQASQAAAQNKSAFHFAVVEENDEYLGTISLKDIDIEKGSAEYAISLRKNSHGKGLGTKATLKILQIAFDELGLQQVFLNVLSTNERAINLYQKCGFRYTKETTGHLKNGQLATLKWFIITKQNYKEMQNGKNNA